MFDITKSFLFAISRIKFFANVGCYGTVFYCYSNPLLTKSWQIHAAITISLLY